MHPAYDKLDPELTAPLSALLLATVRMPLSGKHFSQERSRGVGEEEDSAWPALLNFHPQYVFHVLGGSPTNADSTLCQVPDAEL